jgi:hypothetical protein
MFPNPGEAHAPPRGDNRSLRPESRLDPPGARGVPGWTTHERL